MKKAVREDRHSQPSAGTPAIGSTATEDRLRELTHDLIERIKELNCLYGISRLVEQEQMPLDRLLQGVVDLMPPAWQYPDVTCARITVRGREFASRSFRQTEWEQVEAITVNGRRAGRVEVYYLKAMPFSFEGPFLREERDLIHGIAERLGHIIESRAAEATLQKLYSRERKLRRRLQSEMQNRVEFTRLLIHELKTPLTSLMATSQLLAEETKASNLEKLAKYVWDGAVSLNDRIDELHDVIRGETGRLKLDSQVLSIEDLLAAIVEEMRALSNLHGVDIALDVVGGPLPRVCADAVRIRQVMFNLINNACQYASSGKRITVKVSRDESGNAVVTEVRDYGPGIPKDRLRHIFRPGYQASSRTETPGGLGIGLALCKMLVELHNGRIWAESAVGKGSSFFLSLPAGERCATLVD